MTPDDLRGLRVLHQCDAHGPPDLCLGLNIGVKSSQLGLIQESWSVSSVRSDIYLVLMDIDPNITGYLCLLVVKHLTLDPKTSA
jgi:hypothetical protein